jgi:hypothetical protein
MVDDGMVDDGMVDDGMVDDGMVDDGMFTILTVNVRAHAVVWRAPYRFDIGIWTHEATPYYVVWYRHTMSQHHTSHTILGPNTMFHTILCPMSHTILYPNTILCPVSYTTL